MSRKRYARPFTPALSALPYPEMSTAKRARLVVLMGILLAGCSSVAIPPAYTQAELKAECDRRRGWWRPDDLIGGYCDFRGP